MGSPLGVLFANFFMGSIEEEIFKNIQTPQICCRYIDDIFVKSEDAEQIEALRQHLMDAYCLNFTIEHSENGSIPFLDILVKQGEQSFTTSVYVNATNPGHCLNGLSECPQKYLDSTISAYIRRAPSHCSNWTSVHDELERASQVLVNNGFANKDIERITRKIVDKWYQSTNPITVQQKPEESIIKIFYKSYFSTAYKEDESIMKQIIKRNIKPADPNSKVNFIIYYQNSSLGLRTLHRYHTSIRYSTL